MRQEHKQKISESNKGITRNSGKIWITNGKHVTRIFPEDYHDWANKGYVLGKKLDGKCYVAWNRGLTKDDPRVKAYLESRGKK